MNPRSALARVVCLAVAVALLATVPASGFRLQGLLTPVSGNPVEALASLPVDAPIYDPATHCTRKPQPGMVAFQRWLEGHAPGVAWGTYRCERWGKHHASLHAEGRALDWHLDVGRPADRAAARTLITELLAPDSTGTPDALARRMGVEEIIWDCSYWSAGMDEFRRYPPCFSKRGRPRHKVDRTIAHRNHIHFGMTKLGAAGRTSFWMLQKLGSLDRVREQLINSLPLPGSDPSGDLPVEDPGQGDGASGGDDGDPAWDEGPSPDAPGDGW